MQDDVCSPGMYGKPKKNLDPHVEQGSDRKLWGQRQLGAQDAYAPFPVPPSIAGATDAAHGHPQDHQRWERAPPPHGHTTPGPRSCKATQAPRRREQATAHHAPHNKALRRAQPPFSLF